MLKDVDDALIVRRCLNGESRAFEVIIDKYQKTIYNLALRMVSDTQDAEDIAQTVFIKVYENLRSYNPKYKFFSWMYRIALNESINFVQQKKKLEEIDADVVSNDGTPDQEYSEIELRENVQLALMRLKVDYRVVIVLSHFQDLSYDEIAYILEIPIKTVKSRLFTARQLLREILIKRRVYE